MKEDKIRPFNIYVELRRDHQRRPLDALERDVVHYSSFVSWYRPSPKYIYIASSPFPLPPHNTSDASCHSSLPSSLDKIAPMLPILFIRCVLGVIASFDSGGVGRDEGRLLSSFAPSSSSVVATTIVSDVCDESETLPPSPSTTVVSAAENRRDALVP